jgi:hypothetical protein
MHQDHDDLAAILDDLDLGTGADFRIAGEQVELRFVRELGELLLADDLSHAELGRRLGLQRSQIRRWLSGDSAVKMGVAASLAAAAGYECEVVLRRREERADYARGSGADIVVAVGRPMGRSNVVEPTVSQACAA